MLRPSTRKGCPDAANDSTGVARLETRRDRREKEFVQLRVAATGNTLLACARPDQRITTMRRAPLPAGVTSRAKQTPAATRPPIALRRATTICFTPL